MHTGWSSWRPRLFSVAVLLALAWLAGAYAADGRPAAAAGIGSPQAGVAAPNACTIYSSTDVPKSIPDNSVSGVTSTLNVPDNVAIGDVNVVNLSLNHTYMSDLSVRLISPHE